MVPVRAEGWWKGDQHVGRNFNRLTVELPTRKTWLPMLLSKDNARRDGHDVDSDSDDDLGDSPPGSPASPPPGLPPPSSGPPPGTQATDSRTVPASTNGPTPITTIIPAPHRSTAALSGIPTATTAQSSTSTSSTPVATANVPGFTVDVPRKALDSITETESFILSTSSSAASSTTATEPLPVESFSPDDDGPLVLPESGRADPYQDGGHHDRALGPGGERALIALGSIGIFTLVCLVGWFAWKKMKEMRSRRLMDNSLDKARPNMAYRAAAKVRWLRDRFGQQGWVSMDDGPVCEGSAFASSMPSERKVPVLDLRFGPSMPGSLDMVSPASAPSAVAVGQNQGQDQDQDKSVVFPSPVSYYSGGDGPYERPVFAKQSEISRQPSDARDPLQSNVNRLSAPSSLSSGFGDGDIIVEPQGAVIREHGATGTSQNLLLNSASRPMLLPQQQPSTGPMPLRKSLLRTSRFSWASRRSNNHNNNNSNSNSNRDTVYTAYTATSQDSPVRFRSLNEWVSQQTGRVQRAQRRRAAGEGEGEGSGWDVGEVPPMPGIPAGLDGVGGETARRVGGGA